MKGYRMKQKRKYYKRCAEYVPRIYNPLDLAYLAGIIDGEGCFYIGKVPINNGYKSEHYRSLLTVTNTDSRLIDWILSTFDGTETTTQRIKPTQKYQRMLFSWTSTGDRLRDLCEQILPYLVIKKEHCEIMIKFRKTFIARMGNNQLSPEILAIRQQLLIDIRQLNSRFHDHPLKDRNRNKPSALSPVS